MRGDQPATRQRRCRTEYQTHAHQQAGVAEDHPQHITLIDEDGSERQFRLHDAFELDGAAYYLVENVDDADQVLLLKEGDGGLESIDGDEFQRVMTALEEDKVE